MDDLGKHTDLQTATEASSEKYGEAPQAGAVNEPIVIDDDSQSQEYGHHTATWRSGGVAASAGYLSHKPPGSS